MRCGSVGVAAVKFVAKIASAFRKPDGLTEVPPGDEQRFLHPLPVGKLWGVGPRAEETLRKHRVRTVGQLAALGHRRLGELFGEHGTHLWRLSQGMDERPVTPGRRAKSLSSEDTYADDVRGREALEARLLAHATRVADRLTRQGYRGRRVHIKIRDVQFKTETRQLTLEHPTAEAAVIFRHAKLLLDKVQVEGRAFRLTGVGVADLRMEGEASAQLQLVPDEGSGAREHDRKVQEALTAVRGKFGTSALFPAGAARGRVAEGGRALTRGASEDGAGGKDPDER